MSSLNDIKVAIAFLTRVKVKHSTQVSIPRSARWFPLVGLLVGLFLAVITLILHALLPNFSAVSLTLLVSVLVTGGFHQDGLADIFDGLVGGWNIEDRLRILKDSRHGTYGVLSIVMQVLVQVSLLSNLSAMQCAIALIVSHTTARVVPLYFMMAKAVPNYSGMGASASQEISFRDLLLPTFFTLLLDVLLLRWLTFLLVSTLAIVNIIFFRFVKNRIGGILGDALGAAEQISESSVLFVVATSVYLGIGSL